MSLLANAAVPAQAVPLRFHSILYDKPDAPRPGTAAPAYFHDLNLDQVVDGITAGRKEYDLAPFFHSPLHDLDAIAYRQEVMRDLRAPGLMQTVGQFAQRMRSMREDLALAEKLYYPYEKQWWFLAAVVHYGEGIADLAQCLQHTGLQSRGLRAFGEWLTGYASGAAYQTLLAQTRTLQFDLAAIRYSLLIKDMSITVRAYDDEVDESAAVERTFEKFKRGAPKDYRAKFYEGRGLNQVQAQVLDRVALLNPETFRALDNFCTQHAAYLDTTVAVFDREVQFYVAMLEFTGVFERAGLSFCYPRLSDVDKDVACSGAFDLALAHKLVRDKAEVVCNDFALRGAERIFVVSGPNQGGKTTFARTFGQLHHLACLGCPVPGTSARLFLFDQLFCHFERAEDIANLSGKLQDDLVRIKKILDRATPESVVIMNEIFSSTSLKDAVDLGPVIICRSSRVQIGLR